MPSIRIDRRFCGPPGTGNGGYTCGRTAGPLSGPAEVTLRAPSPLDTELALEEQGETILLRAPDGTLVAEAKPVSVELEVPPSVSFAEALDASARYIGFNQHPYPGCFVCGPARPVELGSGLGLFPGAVVPQADGQARVAAPFSPASDLCDSEGVLRPEFVWAALDCPSWFGHAAFAAEVPKILLGRLSASIVRRPRAGERCVVQGWSLGQEGRRILCASALYGDDGSCLARARATWIALKDA